MTNSPGQLLLVAKARSLWSYLLSLMMLLGGTMYPLVASAKGPDNDSSNRAQSPFKGESSGILNARDPNGKLLGQCPLKHTDVSAKISGFVARVTVKQLFHNPYNKKIEAVYTFPLSDSGAVDDMVLRVGDRTIHGAIKRREEAKQIYDDARDSGQVAALLEQERPNVFTQSVANIEPGKSIEVTLQYVDMLPFEDGRYTFAFPTVVGPRFNPGELTSTAAEHIAETSTNNVIPASFTPHSNSGVALNAFERPVVTAAVNDANLVTPPVVKPGFRSGHDISIAVDIDSGVTMTDLRSISHPVQLQLINDHNAHIDLSRNDAVPNKDFVLSWNVLDKNIRSGCLIHKQGTSGYFNLVLMPPKRIRTAEVAPKEMIFLIDRSGSQDGEPLQKCKETMNYILDKMNPQDTFQIVSFSDTAEMLFDRPQKANLGMKLKAHNYINSITADGGTWMGPAVEKVCQLPIDPGRLRIVTFMTDGLVGNDMEIFGLVRKFRGSSRWFTFGTGSSVNRNLIDGVAKEGGGEAEYVLLESKGEEVAKHFYDRISTPVLTDVKVTVEGIDAKDIYPRQISDVWAQKPLYVSGRYTKPGMGRVTLSGFAGGRPYKQQMNIEFPNVHKDNPGVASVWARSVVDALMAEDWFRAQTGAPLPEIKEAIVQVALVHHIMTQYTSFVAVDDSRKTPGNSLKVDVPVELPAGVSYDKIFGMEMKPTATPVAEYSSSNASITVVGTPNLGKAVSDLGSSFQDHLSVPSGLPSSICNWFVASSRDANLFDGGSSSPALSLPSLPSFGSSQEAAQGSAMSSNSGSAQGAASSSSFGNAYSGSPTTSYNKGAAPLAASNSFGAANSGSQTMQYAGNGPMLQGATNGSIGPQGTAATVIMGVNTAGSVRVNNLANLEAMLNIICNLLDLSVLLIGGIAIIRGVIYAKRGNGKLGFRTASWGIIWLLVGFIFSPLLLVMLIQSAWGWRRKPA